jgi:hypothetical protein
MSKQYVSGLDDDEIKILKDELKRSKYSGVDPDAAWRMFHSEEMVQNPEPPPRVDPNIDGDWFMDRITVSRKKVVLWPGLPWLLDRLDLDDVAAGKRWAKLLFDADLIDQAEMDHLLRDLSPVVAPDWPAEIVAPSPKDRLFGGKSWEWSDGTSSDQVHSDIFESIMGGDKP